jgi:hypothetical protein
MKKPEMPQVWQATSCLLCVLFALKITDGLAGTEFSGGRLTGPLLSMADIGSFFFVLALVVTFVYPRVAAVVGLASSLLCLPLFFSSSRQSRAIRSSDLGTSLRFNRLRPPLGEYGQRQVYSPTPSRMFCAFAVSQHAERQRPSRGERWT